MEEEIISPIKLKVIIGEEVKMLNQSKVIPKSPDSILEQMESFFKTPEESHALAMEHTKQEIKDQIAFWRKESAQDEKDKSDTICYSKARLQAYLDLLAFIAEHY